MQNVPKTTKGVILQEVPTNPPVYGEATLPELTEDSVLVKIHSAPINPADVQCVKGVFPHGKTLPTTSGLEGSGLVIAAGASEKAQALLNKRVCFLTGPKPGSWGEHTVIAAKQAHVLPDDVDYEQGAMVLVNPLTVAGFLLVCEERGYTSIAHAAAASQIGRNLISGAKKAGITVVNFVRRAEQAKILNDLGADAVIDKSQEGWEEKAEKVLAEHKVQAYFDALGGEDGGKIFKLLPDESVTHVYGCLTYQPLVVDSSHIRHRGKDVTGFWIKKQLAKPERAKKIFALTFANLAEGVFKSAIANRFTQENFQDALEFYKKGASKGKVLLQNPNFEQ